MRITSVTLTDFRNYEKWTLEPDDRLTILVGPNAAGKTNAIEAIRLITAGSSFRRPRWDELVRWGARKARVTLDASGEGRQVSLVADIDAEGGHSFTHNGKKAKSGRTIAGILPSVVFTPDDLGLVKGPAEQRRSETDDLGEQLSKTYGTLRREYERVVRQRNRLLKGESPVTAEQMGAWNERLITLGAQLRVHRVRLVARLAGEAEAFHRKVCGDEELRIRYVEGPLEGRREIDPATDRAAEEQRLGRDLEDRSADEVSRQVTLVGPHRDDVDFLVDGRSARTYASQGQQRTLVLAWKMAELHVVEQLTKGDAVLLLDDVMSELDAERRRALTAEVGSRVQTFITTTNTGYFDDDLLARAMVVQIGHGVG